MAKTTREKAKEKNLKKREGKMMGVCRPYCEARDYIEQRGAA